MSNYHSAPNFNITLADVFPFLMIEAVQVVVYVGAIIFIWQCLFLFIRGFTCFYKFFLMPGLDILKRYGGEGTWAVITGPDGGQGRLLALELAERGFNLLLIGYKDCFKTGELCLQRARQQKKTIQVRVIVCDFSDALKRREKFFAPIEKELERIGPTNLGVLINAVGHRFAWDPFHMMPTHKIYDVISVGTLVQTRLCHMMIPYFLERRRRIFHAKAVLELARSGAGKELGSESDKKSSGSNGGVNHSTPGFPLRAGGVLPLKEDGSVDIEKVYLENKKPNPSENKEPKSEEDEEKSVGSSRSEREVISVIDNLVEDDFDVSERCRELSEVTDIEFSVEKNEGEKDDKENANEKNVKEKLKSEDEKLNASASSSSLAISMVGQEEAAPSTEPQQTPAFTRQNSGADESTASLKDAREKVLRSSDNFPEEVSDPLPEPPIGDRVEGLPVLPGHESVIDRRERPKRPLFVACARRFRAIVKNRSFKLDASEDEEAFSSCLVNITAQCFHTQSFFGVGQLDPWLCVPFLSVYEPANVYGFAQSNAIFHEYQGLFDILTITPGAVLTENTSSLLTTQFWTNLFSTKAEPFCKNIVRFMGRVDGVHCAYWGHAISHMGLNFIPFGADLVKQRGLRLIGKSVAKSFMREYEEKEAKAKKKNV